MEPLLVYPENAEQLKTVKAFLKAIKVQFEAKPQPLPAHVLKDIQEGLAEYERDGKYLTFDEFKETCFSKK